MMSIETSGSKVAGRGLPDEAACLVCSMMLSGAGLAPIMVCDGIGRGILAGDIVAAGVYALSLRSDHGLVFVASLCIFREQACRDLEIAGTIEIRSKNVPRRSQAFRSVPGRSRFAKMQNEPNCTASANNIRKFPGQLVASIGMSQHNRGAAGSRSGSEERSDGRIERFEVG